VDGIGISRGDPAESVVTRGCPELGACIGQSGSEFEVRASNCWMLPKDKKSGFNFADY
jgi:hypothetical protein